MPVLARLLVLAFPLALAVACTGGEGGSPPPGDDGGAGGTGGGTPDAGALHGTVLLVDGAPAAGATVTLPGREAVVVGSDGAFAFDLLPPGSHELSFSLAPYRSEVRAVAVEAGADTEVAPVVLQRVIEVESDRLYSEAARSFGGSRLVFCAGRDEAAGVTDAWLWDDAGVSRRLATAVDDSFCFRSRGPSFSPDDRFLVFPLARPNPEEEEWSLVECGTGEGRSLGVSGWSEFWPDSSRLVWNQGATGERGRVLSLALPSLEETVLCEGGMALAVSADRGALVCGARLPDAVDPELVRWDLASMESESIARGASIIGISPGLDRAFLLVGGEEGSRTGLLWRQGEPAVTVTTGVRPWNRASCDEAVERGFLLVSGELFHLDLVAGTAVSIDTGVDSMLPAPSHEQVFYYKELVHNRGRLFSWDERSGVTTELGAGVPASSWAPVNDWPRQAAFVADTGASADYLGDLYVYGFGGGAPLRVATRARIQRHDAAGLAYFHDIDETGTGSFSILAPGAQTPTPVLGQLAYRWSDSQSRAPSPRISERMDRVVAYRQIPETGGAQAVAWSREHGEKVLGGYVDELSPSFDRALVFVQGPDPAWSVGQVKLYDFGTGALVTLGEQAGRYGQHDAAWTRFVFTERTDTGGERLLRLYDHASGETRTLLEDAANAVLRPNPAFTHALIWVGLGTANDGYLADLGSGRVDRVALGASWSEEVRSPDGNRILIVEVGYDAAPTSGRLLLLDLPGMTATELDEAAAPETPWVNDDFSAIVYRRDVADPSPQNARDTVGELWARALRPGAVAYPVDHRVRGVVLGTAGSFLYEVEGEGIRAGEWPR